MYEYKIIKFWATETQLMTELNSWGRLGWQLSNCESEGNLLLEKRYYTLLLMKRI